MRNDVGEVDGVLYEFAGATIRMDQGLTQHVRRVERGKRRGQR